MKKIALICALFVLFSAGGLRAQETGSMKKVKLSEGNIYFTEPYSYLDPPEPRGLGMFLDLDYAFIKYPYGFINTVDSNSPLIEFKKKIPITAADQLEKVRKESGFKAGDRVTVVSALGKAYPARISGFSYVGNSPSTVAVMADLVVDGADIDPTLFLDHGLAVVEGDVPETPTLYARGPLKDGDPLKDELFGLCAKDKPEGAIREDKLVVPANISGSVPDTYFVSYWERPEKDFEVDEANIKGCLMRSSGGSYNRAELPLPLRLIGVYDLDRDGKAEIYGMTGNGAEVCYILLAPADGGYRELKRGLCAGY